MSNLFYRIDIKNSQGRVYRYALQSRHPFPSMKGTTFDIEHERDLEGSQSVFEVTVVSYRDDMAFGRYYMNLGLEGGKIGRNGFIVHPRADEIILSLQKDEDWTEITAWH